MPDRTARANAKKDVGRACPRRARLCRAEGQGNGLVRPDHRPGPGNQPRSASPTSSITCAACSGWNASRQSPDDPAAHPAALATAPSKPTATEGFPLPRATLRLQPRRKCGRWRCPTVPGSACPLGRTCSDSFSLSSKHRRRFARTARGARVDPEAAVALRRLRADDGLRTAVMVASSLWHANLRGRRWTFRRGCGSWAWNATKSVSGQRRRCQSAAPLTAEDLRTLGSVGRPSAEPPGRNEGAPTGDRFPRTRTVSGRAASAEPSRGSRATAAHGDVRRSGRLDRAGGAARSRGHGRR